jgi:hypothetical protein
MAFDNVLNIVSDAAVEAGLDAVTAVYASTDKNVILLRTLLKSLGQEIVGERDWTYLQLQTSFNTVNGTGDYPLPAGFKKMAPQSGWNRTTRFPLGGPLSPQEWQYLKAQVSNLSITALFRPMQGRIFIYPTPTSVQEIAYEYLTSYWVAVAAASTTPVKDAPTVDTDVLLIDRLLLVKALAYTFKSKKGLATSNDLDEYESALQKAKDDDAAAAAEILSLGGPKRRLHMIDGSNIPLTGFGS